MKSLKLSELNQYSIMKENELTQLKGGEAGLFCSSGGNCGCGTDAVKASNRRSWRKFNKRCGTTGSTT